MKVPAAPTVNVVDVPEVITLRSSTMRLNGCDAGCPDAVRRHDRYLVNPTRPGHRGPDSVAVPSPLSTKVTPAGRVPAVMEMAGGGYS